MKRTLPVFAVIALLFGFSSSAAALTINDFGVVGAFGSDAIPGPGNPPEQEDAAAEALLDLGLGVTTPGGCTLQPPNNNCFQTNAVFNYSGNLGDPFKVDNNSTDVTGWTWVLGKYDGPNAGYVLFYVPDYGNTIPSLPATIWGNSNDTGLALSHTLRWGATSVPDGGMTLLLLGAAMGGLGLIRRRFNA